MWIRPQDSTRPRRAFLQDQQATEHRQQTTALVGHSHRRMSKAEFCSQTTDLRALQLGGFFVLALAKHRDPKHGD